MTIYNYLMLFLYFENSLGYLRLIYEIKVREGAFINNFDTKRCKVPKNAIKSSKSGEK